MPPRESNRRDVLLGLATACAAACRPAAASGDDSLKARAARKGLLFGCAVTSRELRSEAALREAVLRDCNALVATNEMKWGVIEPARGRRNYVGADALVAFAAQHGLLMRGHTAVWHQNPPRWVPEALREPGGRALMQDHVRAVVGRYRGRVAQWDVVNEAIFHKDRQPGALRNSPFLQALGEDYIADAFRAAREADPAAKLYYNDFAFESAEASHEERRRDVLPLLESLRRQGLVDGIGLQAHLQAGDPFDPERYRRFLADLAGMGLDIMLTEFDVADRRLEADVATRDRRVADYARTYLDVALAEPAVKGLLTWGLSDRHTWLNDEPWRRKDGVPARPLPYDDAMGRKPLWHAIARSLDTAPVRRG
jgi:endo-1,4-beta-xylanase